MAWVSPTGFNDPDVEWTGETNLYDDNLASYASCPYEENVWSGFVELTIGAITCDKVQTYFRASNSYFILDIDAKVDGGWVHVADFTGFTQGWREDSFTAGSVTGYRVRFKEPTYGPATFTHISEVSLWELPPVAVPWGIVV